MNRKNNECEVIEVLEYLVLLHELLIVLQVMFLRTVKVCLGSVGQMSGQWDGLRTAWMTEPGGLWTVVQSLVGDR